MHRLGIYAFQDTGHAPEEHFQHPVQCMSSAAAAVAAKRFLYDCAEDLGAEGLAEKIVASGVGPHAHGGPWGPHQKHPNQGCRRLLCARF
eukprot:8562435-Alexandrium_andersonii.AAC.1